ncbi:MAG: FapA family protein [Candidatus Sericytochromatia bacterium]
MAKRRYHFRLLIPDTPVPFMEAYFYAFPLDASKEQTGYLLNRESILRFLEQEGVCYGILESAITQTLAQGFAHHERIAQGLFPLQGADARFRILVQAALNLYADFLRQMQQQGPMGESPGFEALREAVLAPQTPILQKIPPLTGAPGLNIRGELIAGFKGMDKPFPPSRHTRIADENRLLLLTAIEGIPLFQLPHFIDILPFTLIKRDLNESRFFKGIVAIEGNIGDLVRLRAQADILVWGTVDAAVLIAGRHIWIRQGVKGKDVAILRAGRQINLKFAERATLEAGSSITAESLHHCFSYALHEIRVQYLLGGETLASSLLWADVIGSPGVESIVSCGLTFYLDAELQQLAVRLEESLALLQDLRTELASKDLLFSQEKQILRLHFRNRIPRIEYEIYALRQRLEELQRFKESSRRAVIEIATGMYPGTYLRIQQFEMEWQEFLQEKRRLVAGKYGIIPEKQG